ncbi:enhanced intracellular survival protein Eis [Bacillus sp. FJAT-26390]|uniref:GNAT family N-acetyltransferase n=1 Tax=Bacillus sp. FJAT-26390 TaxID=1743142 RepID=UPI00159ED0D1|nr:GNAT family N-acetyltransferase [Bacillus sp. FJAT-26390]
MEKAIEIKRMGAEQFNDCMALVQFAFQYEYSAEALEQSRMSFMDEPAAYYAAFVDQKFAAQTMVLDLQTYIGGKAFPMGGVAGVATWPEYRRQGLVSKLLVLSLKDMKDKGQLISMLSPFAFGFYRKFGWEIYTEHKAYTIKTELLPARIAYEGQMERFSGDYNRLSEVYEAYASKYNGTLKRTELWWKGRISKRKPGQIALYHDKSGAPKGYVIYEVKNKRLTVHEFIYLNEESRAALWSFIAQHDSMINEVTITVPSDDMLPYLLNNPRIQQEVIPYFMARIVDAEGFVSRYDFETAASQDAIPIEITDEHAPWNKGYYLLEIDQSGTANLRRIEDNQRIDGAIKVDIGTFTSLLLGYLKPLQLSELGRIEGDIAWIKRLHDRIPERITYLPDFF